jgi:hypothetical protein
VDCQGKNRNLSLTEFTEISEIPLILTFSRKGRRNAYGKSAGSVEEESPKSQQIFTAKGAEGNRQRKRGGF